MPIQNVGTLLENLVVTEAASVLLKQCQQQGTPLEFLNSFAMPPRSPWVPNAQNAGFDDNVLRDVREMSDSELPSDATYPRLLRANLLADRSQGPNAALLVAGAAFQQLATCRMWLNDIRDGRYGDAIPLLEKIEATALSIYGLPSSNSPNLIVQVSDAAYPDSLGSLGRVLQKWERVSAAGARLGFLDPMRYRIRNPNDGETSSDDHRRWLAQLAFQGITCAIHFTGHQQHSMLEEELKCLHSDAVCQNYGASRTFKRQHYAVFVAVRSPAPRQTQQIVGDVEARIHRAWTYWCRTFASLRDPQLKTYRDGVAIQ